MSRMITIQIDSEDMKEMLYNRVKHWTDDSETLELFKQYYDNMVDCRCYDGGTFNVMSIVDNDYVNWTSIIDKEEFEKAREEYIKEQVDSDGFSDDDRPKAEDYDEDEQEDFEQELADFDREKQEVLEQYEEDTPTWEDVQDSRVIPDFLDVDYIEAMTDNLILVRY